MTAEDTLTALFARLAGDLAGVSTNATTAGTEYLRNGRPFAVAGDRSAEVKLHPEVAAAAQRTTHTTPSTRGAGWVRFGPPEVDAFALDRAEAWFLSAWRIAGG